MGLVRELGLERFAQAGIPARTVGHLPVLLVPDDVPALRADVGETARSGQVLRDMAERMRDAEGNENRPDRKAV